MATNVLRYFRNNTLRPICSESIPMFTCASYETRIEMAGFLGGRFTDIFDTLKWKIEPVAGVPNWDNLLDKKTGQWSGDFGLFQQNKADLMLMTGGIIGYESITDLPFEFGNVPITQVEYRVFASYEPKSKPSEVLSCLAAIYGPSVWMTILLTLLLTSLALLLLKKKMKSKKGVSALVWELVRYSIDQGTFDTHYFLPKVVITSYALFSFLLISCYFLNYISTDKVVLDTSQLPLTLEDILRLDKIPLMFKEDPDTDRYRFDTHVDSIYYKIFAKMKRVGLNITIKTMQTKEGESNENNTKYAVIAQKRLLEPASDFLCGKKLLMSDGVIPKEKEFISPVDLYSRPMFFRHRKNLPLEANKALDDLFYRLLEQGLFHAIWSKFVVNFRQLFLQRHRNPCLKASFEQVAEEFASSNILGVNLTEVRTVFVLHLFLLLISVTTYVSEIIWRNLCISLTPRNGRSIEENGESHRKTLIQTIIFSLKRCFDNVISGRIANPCINISRKYDKSRTHIRVKIMSEPGLPEALKMRHIRPQVRQAFNPQPRTRITTLTNGGLIHSQWASRVNAPTGSSIGEKGHHTEAIKRRDLRKNTQLKYTPVKNTFQVQADVHY